MATALLAALAYSSLISLRVFQKSGSRRSSTFTYSIVLLGIQGTRTLGAILLASVRSLSDQPHLLPLDPVPAAAGLPLRPLPLPEHHPGPQSPQPDQPLHRGRHGGRRLAGGRL